MLSKLEALFTEQRKADAPVSLPQNTLLEDTKLVTNALLLGAKSRDQLILDTGLGGADLAKATHYLLSLSPPYIEKQTIRNPLGEITDCKYFLTKVGRQMSSPPPTPDWHGPDVDPRRSPDKRMIKKANGTTHITGLPGHIRINPDGSLNLSGKQGMIYDYVKDHPYSTANDIAGALNIAIGTVWNIMYKLTDPKIDAKIFDYDELGAKTNGGSCRRYWVPGFQTKPEFKPEDVIAPQTLNYFKHGTDTPTPPVDPAPALPTPSPNSQLVQRVQELIRTYGSTDVLLTIITELDKELIELRQFRQHTQELMKSIDSE